MLVKSDLALFAMVLLFAASADAIAAPKTSNFPNLDLEQRCRSSARAAQEMYQDGTRAQDAYDQCLKSENVARDALNTAWAEIPPDYKSFCIVPTAFSASYIEWLVCIEMKIDLKKQRSGDGGQSRSMSAGCPGMHYADDGSIKLVKACALAR
jgi:hypothetical protein